MTDSTRHPAVPFRINIEQQKKRARELLRAARAGDDAALARFAAKHPHAPAAPVLADAQLVIARELGLPSWPRLRDHVAGMQAAAAAIAGDAPDDADTLHIRCGSDIHDALRLAGFIGGFFEYSNPFCQGPVLRGEAFLPARARFIAEGYSGAVPHDEAAILQRLQAEELSLAKASARRHVVIWKEHDSYDQLILARILAAVHDNGAPRRLELIDINSFPGSVPFLGLGQLPPEGLRLLWARRRPVTPAMLAAGARIWDALRDPDPTALADIAASPIPGLPDMSRALTRHLQELPWMQDGLSLTQRLALVQLKTATPTIGATFSHLMRETEPLPYLGDLMYFHIIEDMAAAGEPPFTIGGEARWAERTLHLTEAGHAVLDGRRDWLSLRPRERFVGGVRITPGNGVWRWDADAGQPVHH